MAEDRRAILLDDLEKLRREPGITSVQIRDCIEMLIKMNRNLQLNSDNVDKYKSIKVSNQNFNDKVWKFPSARKFLHHSGWKIDEDEDLFQIIRPDEKAYYKSCLNILVENRLVQPNLDEWTEHNKLVSLNEESLREKELRKKAAEERRKEYENCLKEKEDRKKLGDMIKQEIQADIEHRKKLQPVRGGQREQNLEQSFDCHKN